MKLPQFFARVCAVWLALSSAGTFGQVVAATNTLSDTLSIDCGRTLHDIRQRPTGVNLDYLSDDDHHTWLSPRRTLAEALQELGARYLRYPGGWKSAINLWSVPPFDSSRPALAGPIPEGWIRAGVRLTKPDGTWNIDPLDFDEFMEVCRAIGGEPNIVVPYESMHWPATRDWQPPSRERLLETAAAWVRYSNKVKRHGVKLWEIGNESWWSDKPVLHVFPHWTWPGREGQEIAVWVYSNCESVELFLNGQSLGAQTMLRNGHLEWRVKYAPGKLIACGKRNGATITTAVQTTGPPAAIKLEPNRTKIAPDGSDVSLVAVKIVDAQGRIVPTASNRVEFSVTGAGCLLGVGNGDPACHEPDKANQRSAFNGLCLAIIQAGLTNGTITLNGESAGLAPAVASFDVQD